MDAEGHGVVTDGRNRDLLTGRERVVWLRARTETLSARVGTGVGRPLIAGGDVPTELARLSTERMPLYGEVADVIVDVDDLSVDEVVDRIMMELA